jgi:hypothetical protein
MHDQELLRRAQYDQANGTPDDLYIIPTTYAPLASPGAVNNFPTFSRRLRTIRYPKDFKPAIEKYDGRSDASIWLKMYNIVARTSGGNEDHMAGYFPLVMGKHHSCGLTIFLQSASPFGQPCHNSSRLTTRRPTIVLATPINLLECG